LSIYAGHDDIAAGEQRIVGTSGELGVSFDPSHQPKRFGISGGNVDLGGPVDVLLSRAHNSRKIGFLDDVTVEQNNLADAKMRELHRHK
jgi:hypothetical protein